MNSTTTSRRVRQLAVIAVIAVFFSSVFVVLTPFTSIPFLSPSSASAGNVTAPGGGGGSTGGSGCTGTSCTSTSSTCDQATGQGLLNGSLLYDAPFPLCYTGPHGPPFTANTYQTCAVAFLTWRFYGSGSVNGTDTVNSYTLSSAIPQDYCTGTPTSIGYNLYAPDPADSPAANVAVYEKTPGDAWCQTGDAFPQSYGATPTAACIGVSPHTFSEFHIAPDGLITTLPPDAIVDNAGQSCRALQTSPDPVAALLSNTTLVNNPFGSSPKTVTVATAVKEALIGSKSQLGGKESTYDFWQHLVNTTPVMAAAVINDASAANPRNAVPVVGNLSSLSYGDGVSCSSDLDFTSTSLSTEKNYGTCTIPVMRQVVAFGNSWAFPTWTVSKDGATDWVYAGARFDQRSGNGGAANWRKIIYNDVLSGQIRSGNSGTQPGPAYGFPYSAYINNGIYATAEDPITAAQQASTGADCYFGSGGVVSGKTSSSSTASTTEGVMPPANAIVQLALQPEPSYGATGGTLHPNTFTAIATGLLCPDPTSGQYEDCNTLYPGQYTLNSINWHLTLNTNSAAYKQCAQQTQKGCQFYIAQQNNVGPLVAYFYSATQPGQTLSLDVTGISGSYTVTASASTTTGSTKSSGSILFCGDGTFNNNQSGLSALSCAAGGGVTLTAAAPDTTTTTSPGTTTTAPGGSGTTYSCTAPWTLSGSNCTRVVTSITTSAACVNAGDKWSGGQCITTIPANIGSGSGGGTTPTTTPIVTKYSCPSGWTLSGTTCTRVVTSVTTSALCAHDGDSWSGGQCHASIAATATTTGGGTTPTTTPTGPTTTVLGTTTTTFPQAVTVQFNASNVQVSGQRTVTVLGASSTPGA